MKPKTFAMWIIAVVILCDGILHTNNFRPRQCYEPMIEIELSDIHFTK